MSFTESITYIYIVGIRAEKTKGSLSPPSRQSVGLFSSHHSLSLSFSLFSSLSLLLYLSLSLFSFSCSSTSGFISTVFLCPSPSPRVRPIRRVLHINSADGGPLNCCRNTQAGSDEFMFRLFMTRRAPNRSTLWLVRLSTPPYGVAAVNMPETRSTLETRKLSPRDLFLLLTNRFRSHPGIYGPYSCLRRVCRYVEFGEWMRQFYFYCQK